MVIIIREKSELEDKVTIGEYKYPKKVDPLRTNADINLEDYILIHEGNSPKLEANYAISAMQGFNGYNHQETHMEVLESGLLIPTSKMFLTHLTNFYNAINGTGVLYDANGDIIERERLDEYFKSIKNHRVWSNESFDETTTNGFLNLDVVTIIGLENGEPATNRKSLERCLDKYCLADLDSINEQGFLTKESSTKKYEPGKNIYFRPPKKGKVAGLGADPDDAGFGCSRYSLFSGSWLGVFASIEDAS